MGNNVQVDHATMAESAQKVGIVMSVIVRLRISLDQLVEKKQQPYISMVQTTLWYVTQKLLGIFYLEIIQTNLLVS